MVGAAISDCHLGAVRFSKTEDGRSAHEVAVERAWFAAVDAIIASGDVQLCTIAGDLFEHHRVGVRAMVAYLRGVRRLSDAGIIVVVLAGNHDVPRSSDSLTPLALLADYLTLGALAEVHIVTEPRTIDLTVYGDCQRMDGYEIVDDATKETVHVACFPFVTLADPKVYQLNVAPQADVNILVAHCSVAGDDLGLPKFYGHDAAFNVTALAERFDVVALGDYHSFTRLHPSRLAFYSGSLEFTSTNLWAEAPEKGWVWYDTATGTMELREVKGRTVESHDEPGAWNADGVNGWLRHQLDRSDLATTLLRLVVEDFPPAEKAQLDQRLVRELKGRAAHFQLDLKMAKSASAEIGDRREGGKSLADAAREWFAEDEAAVRELAFKYMEVPRTCA